MFKLGRHESIPKSVLEDLYLDKHMTMAEIGKMFGKTRQRICQLIKAYEINTTKAEVFNIHCAYPVCNREFQTTRKRFNAVSLRYCSSECYHSHRSSIKAYNPSRQGQRIARTIMEKHLGRPLTPIEVVHHIDANDDNNDLNNLILFSSQSEHLRFHHQIRTLCSNSLDGIPKWCLPYMSE